MSLFSKIIDKSNPFSKDFWLWSGERELGNWLFGGKSAGDAFKDYYGMNVGDGSGLLNTIGDAVNDASGQTASDIFRDQLADENATVAHDRQKELMALEAEYNSPVYKSNQLAKAGLNPALASGVSNSVSGATAQMSNPNPGQGNTSNIVGMLMDIQKTRQELKESDSRIKANEASAKASEANAERSLSEKTLIDKQVSMFEENFNLEKGLKEAQTAHLRQAEKNMKNWLTNGSISSLSQLIQSIGITIGAIKGFASPQNSEVLIPEVVEPLDNGGTIKTPDFDDVPKRLTSGNVKGTRSYEYDAKNKTGRYTMDDGSIFEYGVGEDGYPWATARSKGHNGDSQADDLLSDWMERLKPLFGE